MAEREFQPGEIVTILIEDARVVDVRDGVLSFQYVEDRAADEPYTRWSEVVHSAANVQVTRVQPAELPKDGELWQDATGRRWLAARVDDQVRLFGPTAGPAGYEVNFVHRNDGPLTLVYRDGGAL